METNTKLGLILVDSYTKTLSHLDMSPSKAGNLYLLIYTIGFLSKMRNGKEDAYLFYEGTRTSLMYRDGLKVVPRLQTS